MKHVEKKFDLEIKIPPVILNLDENQGCNLAERIKAKHDKKGYNWQSNVIKQNFMKGKGYLDGYDFRCFGEHISSELVYNKYFRYWYETNSNPYPIRISNSRIIGDNFFVKVEFKQGISMEICLFEIQIKEWYE